MTPDVARRRLVLEPRGRVEREVGLALAALEDTRSRTRLALHDLPEELVDRKAPNAGTSIGSLLYHVAIIEADWLFDDILGTQETDWPSELFPAEVRADGVHLSEHSGESLAQHLDRLAKVRSMLTDEIGRMSAEDFHRPRARTHHDASPAWVVHHLMQHEAEHRSQIGSVREELGGAR